MTAKPPTPSEAVYTFSQRAQRAVNRWLDYLGCGGFEEFTTADRQQLIRIVQEEIEAATLSPEPCARCAERGPEVELRYNEDGTLDEMVVRVGEECVYHLEQMSDGHWWMASGDVHVNLHANGTIGAVVEDEREKEPTP